MRSKAAVCHAMNFDHITRSVVETEVNTVAYGWKQGHRVQSCPRRFSMWKSGRWGSVLRADRILWSLVRADEYGSIIVDPWSNGGSLRAERRNLHLASVTGKQRNEQVMSKQEGSRSAERDLLFFRPLAMANVPSSVALCLTSQTTQTLKPMLAAQVQKNIRGLMTHGRKALCN
jgi:hypothetical protein